VSLAPVAPGTLHAMPFPSRRSAVMGLRGMVATSQPLAAEAGLRVLCSGGHAVDAAVATAAALAVVEPTGTGLGGDCFALVFDAHTKAVQALDGSGRSPRGLTADLVRARGFAAMPQRGALTVTVPGAVDAWAVLLAAHGRLSLADALAPAIQLAHHGFPVSELVAGAWRRSEALLAADATAREQLLLNGRAPRPGEVMRLPALAATLEAVAADGPAAFYRGAVAEAIVQAVNAAGGVMTADDLAGHRSRWQPALRTPMGEAWLWECGLPTQGIVALEAAALMGEFAPASRAAGGAEVIHLMIECLRTAFADAANAVADPATAPHPVAALLDAAHVRARRAIIHAGRTLPGPVAAMPPSGGTVYLAAVDEEGNGCSLVNSNFMGFGSGIVAGRTGVPLQNRGAGFVLTRGHPNELGPAKQPFHTIIPALLTRRLDDTLLAAFGVMGGHMQPQGHLQVAGNILWWGMDPQRALDAPRFQVTTDDRVALEPAFPPALGRTLERWGHSLVPVGDLPDAGAFGGGQVIGVTPDGVRVGGSDPRKDGLAVAQV